jgi:hypothetical protein
MYERRRVHGREAIDIARRFQVPCELNTLIVREDGTKVSEPIGDLVRAEELAALDPQLVWFEWPEAKRFQAIASSFPALRGVPGIESWHPIVLLRWICEGGHSHGEVLAARFVLGVWNTSTDWPELAKELAFPYPTAAKRFDLFEAMQTWDDGQRAAFVAWARDAYFP